MNVIAISYGDDPHVIGIIRRDEAQTIRQQLNDFAAFNDVQHPENLVGTPYTVQEPMTARRFFEK